MTEFEKKYQSEQNHRQNGSENRFFSVTENCNSAATASKKNLRLWVRIGKYVVLTLVVVWLIVQLKSSWAEMLKYDWKPHWFWLTASGCLYLCGYMPVACLWFLAIKWFGQKPRFFNSIFAYYASQLGKYAPGKAMVIIIRAGMISSDHVSASVATAAVFYETLTMMGTGAFIGSLIIFFFFREHAFYSLIALGVAACSITPIIPPVFTRLLKVLKVGKNDPNVEKAVSCLKFRHLILGVGLTSILWLFFGLSLWAVVQGVGLNAGGLFENLPRYVASVSLATSLGFVVLISPGGLGIREVILSLLLTPYFALILADPENVAFQLKPEALATLVSLVQRVVSIVAEVLIYMVLMFFNSNLKHCLGSRRNQ